jgi:hypothetical protein
MRVVGRAGAALAILFVVGCGQNHGAVGSDAHGLDGHHVVPDAPPPSVDSGLVRQDAGVQPMFGGPGPWPLAPTTVYGAPQGIQEAQVVEAQPDEAQNIWLVTHQALYLLRPGQTTFRRYTDADGLHLSLSQPPGITAVAGGASNIAFVGYEGWEDGNPNEDTQAQKDMGKFDRVILNGDGTLTVTRFNLHDTDAVNYWENRSVRRFLYDHVHHPGNLYIGLNHGVDRLQGDTFADHVHVEVCAGAPCSQPPHTLKIGEWRALAFDAQGNTWQGGEYSAGLLGYTTNIADWVVNDRNHFLVAFGDPYPPNPPVFTPPKEGDPVNLRGIAVAPNGLVWFASGPQWNDSDPTYGIASYDVAHYHLTYYDPAALGFPSKLLVDVVAMPDGTLVFADEHQGLVEWTPPNGPVKRVTTAQGLPSDQISRLYLDTMVKPPALYVATANGLAVMR